MMMMISTLYRYRWKVNLRQMSNTELSDFERNNENVKSLKYLPSLISRASGHRASLLVVSTHATEVTRTSWKWLLIFVLVVKITYCNLLYISVVSKIIRVVSRVYCIYDSSRALIGSYVDVSLITNDIWLAEIGMHSVFSKVTGHITSCGHGGQSTHRIFTEFTDASMPSPTVTGHFVYETFRLRVWLITTSEHIGPHRST